MKFHNLVMFCKDRKEPTVHIEIDKKEIYYPAHVRLGRYGNHIDLYLTSIQDLTNFKNSVLSSYEEAIKGAGYDK